MTTIETFRVKRPRPTKLSDPFQDWSPHFREEVIGTPDNKLQALDFRKVFGPFLPMGYYEESVYFLPLAFRYIVADKEGAITFLEGLIWYVSEYTEQLAQDGILEKVRDCLRECFAFWTKDFVLFPNVAKGPGWGATHYIYVKHSAEIERAITELVRFRQHSDLAEEFVRSLAYNEADPIKAAWYLKLANDKRWFTRIKLDNKAILLLLSRTKRLRRAAELVRRRLPAQEASPLYWYQTFKALNLD